MNLPVSGREILYVRTVESPRAKLEVVEVIPEQEISPVGQCKEIFVLGVVHKPLTMKDTSEV
ncbi:hypothetical protein JXM67_06355 [candidate division WOR-3 bacterium]|nr:hypothetical protein [candidate division WOR-3 bacterium]